MKKIFLVAIFLSISVVAHGDYFGKIECDQDIVWGDVGAESD